VRHFWRSLLITGAALALSAGALAQDLYDTTVLRTINITFHDANWLQLLRNNYVSQTDILADLELDGQVYPDVGVRIRGNTSYTGLPAGSEKFSLNVDMEAVHDGQGLLGYSSLNLNNGFRDPTFCREVVYNNLVASYMPNPRANHVLVTLNGQNWGVYINVQQFNKDMLRSYFADEDGLRIKCANNPNGPGLRYNGSSPSGYTGYEIKDDGGLADPWAALIAVCNAVTNFPVSNLPAIDELFAIDPSIWSVVWENLLTDDDSYVNKGADFMIYRDPADGRSHLLQTDANETFTQTTWSPTRNFTAFNKPVLSHVLASPELRQRYMAHYRVARAELEWAALEPEFAALRALIDSAVQADPKKLYTYANFQDNFTTTVNLAGGGLAGGSIIGIQQFVMQRGTFLNGQTELAAQGPVITGVQASEEFPDASEPVWVTANVAPAGAPVTSVHLYYRGGPGVYERVSMLDDGVSGDGGAGDGVYGALVPIDANAGQQVDFYVGATAGNTFSSVTFEPALAENGPLAYSYSFGAGGVRITEFMYQGLNGEFVEFTNIGDAAVDLTGWSMDDDSATAGAFDLSGAGALEPGESVIVTDVDPAAFIAAWGLSGVTVLGPNTTAGMGRNDTIHLYDGDDDLIDRLRYGDEVFIGTIRTREASGQTCPANIGQDDVFEWSLAQLGDVFGTAASASGDLGTPGRFSAGACCPGDLTGDGDVDFADLNLLLSNYGQAVAPGLFGDIDESGTVDFVDLNLLLSTYGSGC